MGLEELTTTNLSFMEKDKSENNEMSNVKLPGRRPGFPGKK